MCGVYSASKPLRDGLPCEVSLQGHWSSIEFLWTGRVISMYAPRYGSDDELGSFLCPAVATRTSSITPQRAQAEFGIKRIPTAACA